jgi:hypothetical protein
VKYKVKVRHWADWKDGLGSVNGSGLRFRNDNNQRESICFAFGVAFGIEQQRRIGRGRHGMAGHDRVEPVDNVMGLRLVNVTTTTTTTINLSDKVSLRGGQRLLRD